MYSQDSITTLVNRIGWNKPLQTGFMTISEDNLKADSGRRFPNFHQLVTVENMLAMVSEPEIEAEAFNEYLLDFKKQCVIEVVTEILDKNSKYQDEFDYSELIVKKVKYFDNPIGYCVAVKAIELFISSNRKNAEERNATMAYNTLKIELEGLKGDTGVVLSKGIRDLLKTSISKATTLIFPDPIIIQKIDW